jgi:hypothetical protein
MNEGKEYIFRHSDDMPVDSILLDSGVVACVSSLAKAVEFEYPHFFSFGFYLPPGDLVPKEVSSSGATNKTKSKEI